LFAVVNIAAFAGITLFTNYTEWKNETIFSLGSAAVIRHLALIGTYVWVIAIGFFLVRIFSKRRGWLPWIAFFYPIALLVGFKYFYLSSDVLDRLGWDQWVIGASIVGLSYMAFRLSYLVLEVRNHVADTPGLSEYLGFAFFLPIMVVGPITPFSTHQRSLENVKERPVPYGRALLRIIVGATKFFFLANLASQLTYSGILFDGNRHALVDLGIAIVFYYLFLNFSGFCDTAIGLAALVGVQVKENFDNPFAARNMKEFWNRWHITLSEYARDVAFTPVSKGLIGKLGPKYLNLSISAGVLCVFLLIGIWHGVGLLFIVFGLVQAVGVIGNHYYTLWLKRVLGKERYRAYNENRLVNAAARALTFLYFASSLALFANTYNQLGIIRNALFG
jgi:D-alanyl-lipoteichoic acid acyltransferase DltB (MBOAT superfamily)